MRRASCARPFVQTNRSGFNRELSRSLLSVIIRASQRRRTSPSPTGGWGCRTEGAGVTPDGPEDELSAGNGLGEALGMVAAGGATGPEAVGNRLLPAVGRPWWKRVTAAPFLDRVGKPGA